MKTSKPVSLPFALAFVVFFLIYTAAAQKRDPVMSPASRALTAREVARRARRSLVLVRSVGSKGQPLSTASGFFVRQGVVATNYHTIENAEEIRIGPVTAAWDMEATVEATDLVHDLALLVVKDSSVAALPLSRRNPEIGDTVYALGNPRGLEGTFSAGNVSGIRELEPYGELIQVTAPISPGSSGGPILNIQGEVVGIAALILKEAQNINFAVPVRLLTELMKIDAERRLNSKRWEAGQLDFPLPMVLDPARDLTKPPWRWERIGYIPGYAGEGSGANLYCRSGSLRALGSGTKEFIVMMVSRNFRGNIPDGTFTYLTGDLECDCRGRRIKVGLSREYDRDGTMAAPTSQQSEWTEVAHDAEALLLFNYACRKPKLRTRSILEAHACTREVSAHHCP